MFRTSLLPFLLVLLCLPAGCSDEEGDPGGPTRVRMIEGNGVIVESDVPIAGVVEIAFAVPGELRIRQGEEESCSLRIEENLLAHIESRKWSDRLEMEVEDDVQLAPTERIVCEIVVRDLEAATLAGAADLVLEDLRTARLCLTIVGSGRIEVDGLDVREVHTVVTGTGTVDLAGTALEQTLTLAGSGAYMARDLTNQRAGITITGTGSATVRPSQRLSVLIAGAGSVFYIGDPELHVTLQGTGRVVRIAG